MGVAVVAITLAVWLHEVKVKACRPEGSPFRAQANEMQDFTRSTSVQREVSQSGLYASRRALSGRRR